VNQLRQAPATTTITMNSTTGQQMNQDMLKWKIEILPSTMKKVYEYAFYVIHQIKSSLEKAKEKMNKATRAVEDVQMSETFLSDKEKIIKVINDVLQQREK
jgi:hypothetical protein